jgi:hypothetical protein
VLEQSHAEQRIRGGNVLGERMGLAGETAQAIAPRAVEAFAVNRIRRVYRLADQRSHLAPLQASPVAMLDRLGQADALDWAQDTPLRVNPRGFSVAVG